jgi:hypothetical protein
MEQKLELIVRRELEISELTIAIDGLEQETAKQKADIVVLESQLQRPFTAPNYCFFKEINIPPNWTVGREALIRIVEGSSFLFSMTIFNRFLSIFSVQNIVQALTIAWRTLVNYQGSNGS